MTNRTRSPSPDPATPPVLTASPATSGAAQSDSEPVIGGQPRLDRRAFLALAAGAGTLGALGSVLGPPGWDALFGGDGGAAGAMGHDDGARLVVVTLYGGNDGLNTVIPYQDPAYATSRGSLAVAPSAVLPLDEGFGLHPGMPGFKRLWDARLLSVVHGIGFADPDYSHFRSMDIWQSAVPDTPITTGWLGRWLDGTRSSPLRALALGPTVPQLLTGERVQGAAIPAGPLVLPGGAREQALYAALSRRGPQNSPWVAQAAASDRVLLELHERIGPALARTETSDPLHSSEADTMAKKNAPGALAIADGGGGPAGENVLAVQLSVVANLILAGAGAEVYSVEFGGFDTHADQEPLQSSLLSQLDAAVTAFVEALRGTRRGARTVVVVYTEFGRRVAANASGGTDHGWANVAFVAGPSVKGAFHGAPPSLTSLSEGNTVYTTDFRSLFASVLAQVLGADPKPFLSGSFRQFPLL